MNERIPVEVFPPGEYIRDELESRGWTQDVLATIIGRSPRLVNEVITAKRALTPDTAQALGEAFGTSAQVWMNLESVYQLSRVRGQDDAIARRAHLFGLAPIKELIKRRWIEPSDSIEVQESRLKVFYELSSLYAQPEPFPHAARKSTSYNGVTPAQCAWLFRAKHLAKGMTVSPFTETRLQDGLARLRGLCQSIDDIRHVPQVLADSGVRFLVVEQLPNSRIDGSAFWLDAKSPVVVLSLRYDRIDWFWYTLMHDLMHIVHGDGHPSAPTHGEHQFVETDLVGQNAMPISERPPMERKADKAASEFLLPAARLNEFATRVRPRYSKQAIVDFAQQAGVHPGIVVGRLQFRHDIPFSHSREMLEKVRDVVVGVALTDGWGCTVPQPVA
jgi:HTH-type transcriptional regulator / antitoxin HigA